MRYFFSGGKYRALSELQWAPSTTGHDPNPPILVENPPSLNHYVLQCDAGTYNLTGQDALLARGYTLQCDAGAYNLTGQEAFYIMTALTAITKNVGAKIAEIPNVSKTMSLNMGVITHVAGDTLNIFQLPPKSVILAAGIYVVTADAAGNGGTLSLGDAVSATRYVNAKTPNSNDTNLVRESASFVSYDTTDYIKMTVNTGAVDSRLLIWCLFADISKINLGTV